MSNNQNVPSGSIVPEATKLPEAAMFGPETSGGYGSESPKPPSPPTTGLDLAAYRRDFGDHYGISGYDISKARPEIPAESEKALEIWKAKMKEPAPDYKQLLDEGVKYLKMNVADFNTYDHITLKNKAEWAIFIGKILLRMKFLVKKAGYIWGDWAAKKVSFISKRSREKFMNLARRKDCHLYTFLGIDRLDVLCSATKEIEGIDQIGSFLFRHKIQIDLTKEFDLEEFKQLVDTALNQDRLTKHEIEADPTLVRDLTLNHISFDKALISRLVTIKECGGDVKKHLENLSLNRGKKAEKEEERFKDFNSLSNRLIKTIDYILDDSEQLDRVDMESLENLQKKIEALQKAHNTIEI